MNYRKSDLITADDAILEAGYWLHDRSNPENGLPWLVYAGKHGLARRDFDDIARLDALIAKRVPAKWKLFQRGALKIPMVYHPKSLAARELERSLRRGGRSASTDSAALNTRIDKLLGKK